MGVIRNGARSYLNLAKKICTLSRLPGFSAGMVAIVGVDDAQAIAVAFEPWCAVIDILISADNYYNQIDTVNDDGGGEDSTPA
jgi:hypothetical protein